MFSIDCFHVYNQNVLRGVILITFYHWQPEDQHISWYKHQRNQNVSYHTHRRNQHISWFKHQRTNNFGARTPSLPWRHDHVYGWVICSVFHVRVIAFEAGPLTESCLAPYYIGKLVKSWHKSMKTSDNKKSKKIAIFMATTSKCHFLDHKAKFWYLHSRFNI